MFWCVKEKETMKGISRVLINQWFIDFFLVLPLLTLCICSHQLGNKFVENNIIPSKVFFSILALPMYQLYGYKIVPNSNCGQTADK